LLYHYICNVVLQSGRSINQQSHLRSVLSVRASLFAFVYLVRIFCQLYKGLRLLSIASRDLNSYIQILSCLFDVIRVVFFKLI